jgi:hypothetical protein
MGALATPRAAGAAELVFAGRRDEGDETSEKESYKKKTLFVMKRM